MRQVVSKKCFHFSAIIVLLSCIIFGSLSYIYLQNTEVSAGQNGMWIYSISNSHQRTFYIDSKEIVQRGQHNAARDGTIRYRTTGYRLSSTPYNLNQRLSSGSNSSIQNQWITTKVNDLSIVDGVKTTQYTISFNEFMRAAADLGITGQSIVQNGGASIYMHNVFETFLNDATRKTNIFGYQEFLEAEPWGSATREYVMSYYNYEFRLTPNSTYDLRVVAVDTEGNLLTNAINKNNTRINNPLLSRKVIYNEGFQYNLSDINRELKINSTEYLYQGWNYTFTNRRTGKSTKINGTNSPSFNMKLPDALPGSTMTINLVYAKQTPKPYRARVVAIDKDGKQIMEMVSEFPVRAGETYGYTVPERRLILNNIHHYQHKWYLSYTDRSTNSTKNISIQNSTNISYVMPDAKENTLATFYMIYDISSGAIPTPSLTPIPKPGEPSPPNPLPTPTPYIPEVVAPLPEYVSLPFTQVITSGKLRADHRGSELFDVNLGVPTTESLYGEVTATEYLLGYSFVKRTGIKYYPITVRKEYHLEWYTATPGTEGGGRPVTEIITVEQRVTVPRAYAYWEIENFECFQVDNAVINNYALPNGSITISPNYGFYSPPSVQVIHNREEEYHIIPPIEVIEGITLPAEVIKGDIRKPSIPDEDFTYIAHIQTGNNRVRSDTLIFNNNTVISGEISEIEAPVIQLEYMPQCYSLTNQNVLYLPNQLIEATKRNGIYSSTGVISYRAISRIRSSKLEIIKYNIEGINQVIIHTPVICNPSITSDNDKYVQLISPSVGAVQLVLDSDPTLSDFVVHISNTGHHSYKQGYFTSDFSKTLRDPTLSYLADKKGILRNEVLFPFDVYIDVGNDLDTNNDDYIKAGTWITLGRASARFYLPMWTKEGIYEVNFRSIAINGENYIHLNQRYANAELVNYVATETLRVEVSGRLYGLSVYDISDYPLWESVFRVPNSMRLKKDDPNYIDGTDKASYNNKYYYTYTVGTNNQYGDDTGRNVKFTLPLINGSHPLYRNQGILKTGYLTRFSLETIGSMYSDNCFVQIKPSFFFVDAEGKNRVPVDLYYSEEINGRSRHLVKMGNALDLTNIKSYQVGDINLGIPLFELRETAKLRNTSLGNWIAQRGPLFTFTNIRMNYNFRTFVNHEYTSKIKSHPSYISVVESGINDSDILKLRQRWYGQYYLPNEVHAVGLGFDVIGYAEKYGINYRENFWLRDGYVIIHFNIYTVDEHGNRRLSYTNAVNYLEKGHCSMWIMEGPPITKKDTTGTEFQFYAGDFMMYHTTKRMAHDYRRGAIY